MSDYIVAQYLRQVWLGVFNKAFLVAVWGKKGAFWQDLRLNSGQSRFFAKGK
jgi:hypothetical protein